MLLEDPSQQVAINPDIAKLGTSATLASRLKVNALRAQGEIISNFGLGESPFGGPKTVTDSIAKNAYRTSYLPTAGIPELRGMISRFYEQYYDFKFDSSQVIVAPGSKELLFNTMLAIDTTWLFFSPSWVSYESQAKMLGRPYYQIHLDYKDHFKITAQSIIHRFNEIDDQLHGRTLSILLNYPNNPTGLTLSNHEVRCIARFARNNEVLILSDEIYSNITHDDYKEKHLSMGIEYPEGTIVTGGISKDRSMGGTRFGLAIVPESQPQILKALKAIGSETYSAVSAPVQYGCVRAYDLNEETDLHIKDSTSIHSLVGKVVYDKLNKAKYHLPEPEGAFYLMPSLNEHRTALEEKGIFTSKALMNTLLERYSVVGIPGIAFGLRKDDLSFRIAYIDYDGPATLANFREDPDEAKANPEKFVLENAPSLMNGLTSFANFTKDL